MVLLIIFITIALTILGALGYLEQLVGFKWSRKTLGILLVCYILLSGGQQLIQWYSEEAKDVEVRELKLQSMLPVLGDKAILEGDREAFEEIKRIAQSERGNSSLKKAAIEEIERVNSKCRDNFDSGHSIITIPPITIPLSYTHTYTLTMKDGTVKKGQDIPTEILITSLYDQDWKVRDIAARILGNRKEKGVPDILLKVMRSDIHLRSTCSASASFKHLARSSYEPGNIDVVNKYKEFLKAGNIDVFNNYKEFLKKRSIDQSYEITYELSNINIDWLKQWWKERVIIQLLKLKSLDIDGHEQWWQEHSEEVNEQLTEMK